MLLPQPLLFNYTNVTTVVRNYRKITTSEEILHTMLPECYHDALMWAGRFSIISFAYLSLETKKKGDDNGTHKSN